MDLPIVTSRYDYVNVFFNNLSSLVVNEYIRRIRNNEKVILPSVALAMGALESGYNINAKTLFGIKGTGEVLDTTEYINGEYINLKDSFRVYDSLAESIQGLYELMQWINYDRATSCTDFEEQCRMIKACGYATDPNYADKIISIINSNQLTMFDMFAKSELADFILNESDSEESSQDKNESEESSQDENEPEESNEYEVQSGDNLWSIVRREYGYNNDTDIANKINQIVSYNDIENPDLIYAGQIIVLI